jgi:hypothetical protein
MLLRGSRVFCIFNKTLKVVLKRLSLLITFIFVLCSTKIEANPTISNFGYTTFTCSSTSRTFSVTISDPSVVANGSLTPRAYYRKNSNSYSSITGTLTAGTLTNGVWAFTMPFSLTGGDFIYFYVAAQNNLGSISAYPSQGFSATDVNNIITDVTNPLGFYYGVLNGTYTVGSGGNFTRLTDAAIAYSSDCTTFLGAITFVLTDTLYSPTTGEVFPIVFKDHFGSSPTNSLLIKPSLGNSVIIRSDTGATSVIKFTNTKYFMLDGFNGSSLGITIQHRKTSSYGIGAVYLAQEPIISGGCENGVIKNLNLYGSNSGAGIFVGKDALVNPVGGIHKDLTFTNNGIFGGAAGIYVSGDCTNQLTKIPNLTISSNTVAYTNFPTFVNNIQGGAINISCLTAPVIKQNLIQYCSVAGLICSNANTVTVTENTVRCINDSLGGYNTLFGMNFLIGNTNVFVKNNIIDNIRTFNSTYGAVGLNLYASRDIWVQNNMISDISCMKSNSSYTSWPAGIGLSNTGFAYLEHNSVSLSGSHPSNSGNMGSMALVISGNFTSSPISNSWVNNVFSNTYDHAGSTTDTCYAIYANNGSTIGYGLCNYNDYYAGGTGNTPVLGRYFSTNLTNLSAIQSTFGGDQNSYTVAPLFVSQNDLHAVSNISQVLDNNGTPLAGVTTDIDNQSRSLSTPDIGADEYTNTSPCTNSLFGTITTNSINGCSGKTVTLSLIGGGSGTGFTYQWKYSTIPSGPYSNVIGGSGANTTTYITSTLSTGVFYYVLEKTCTSASMTSISNEATVTIDPTPTATATSSSYTVCPGKLLYLYGSTDIGTTFTWMGPGTFSSTTQNPGDFPQTSSGYYYFTATLGNCTSDPAAVSFSVHPYNQSTFAVTPSSIICIGNSVTAYGTGATSYTWSTYPWTSTTNASSIVITPTLSAWSYTVRTLDVNGCFSGSFLGYIDLYPQPNITSSSLLLCSGQSATLAVNGATTYSWNTGPTTQSIAVTPSATTIYSVSVTYTPGCSYTLTETITVSACTSVNEMIYDNINVSILPNPNNGNFVLLINKNTVNGELNVFNSLGQEVYRQSVFGNENYIKLNNFSIGLYYFKLTQKDQPDNIGKFVIE